jgi:RHS repeat-associated protein
MASFTDENSAVSNFSYDVMWRPTQILYPTEAVGQGETDFLYQTSSYPATVTASRKIDSRFKVEQTLFDGLGRPTQVQQTSDISGIFTDTAYDAMGRISVGSNPYRSTGDPTYGYTSYLYDALGRKTSLTHSSDGSGQGWTYSGNQVISQDEGGNQWQQTTDALGRLTAVQEPNGVTQTPSMQTDYSYDALGNLRSVTQWGGVTGPSGGLSRSFSYDSLSRLITASNPETGTVCYGVWSGTSCVNGYDANGNLLYKTDARGVITSYRYDALNRLLSKRYSNDPVNTPTACYEYDSSSIASAGANSAGRLTNEWTQAASAGDCPQNLPSSSYITRRSVLAHDARGRVSSEQQCTPLNCTGGSTPSLSYTYDLLGNILTSGNGIGTLAFTTGYDSDNRLISVMGRKADGTSSESLFTATAYGPIGLQDAIYGTALNAHMNYDARLRTTGSTTQGLLSSGVATAGSVIIQGTEQSKTQAATGTVTISGADAAVQNCADADGTPIKCRTVYDTGIIYVLVNGINASCTYTKLSTYTTLATNLAAAINANTSMPVSATSSAGVITLTSKVVGASYTLSAASTSDNSLASFVAKASGTSMTAGTTIYHAGTVTASINGTSASASFGQGSTSSTVASSLAAAINKADSAFLSATVSASTITLMVLQNSSTTSWPITATISYDSADFSAPSFGATMTSATTPSTSAGTVYSYNLTYQPNGNIQTLTDSVVGNWTYGYDTLNRLTTATSSSGAYVGATINWGFDGFGNRLSQSGLGNSSVSMFQGTHTYSNNRVDGLSYDAAGNMLADAAGNQFTYDAEGRLSTFQGSAGTFKYVYDAEGRRVAKLNASGSVIASYVLGPGGEQVTEVDGSGNWVHTNVFAGGHLMATYDNDGSAYPRLHFQLSDWLGSRRGQTNYAGVLELSCSNLPFGDNLNCSGSASDATEHHFTGKERDAESGLDYFGARYYVSNMGRFMSPDKPFADQHIGNPQSWNLYSYTRNNPLRYVDDDGEEVKESATTVYYHVSGSNAAEAWNNAPAASGIGGGYRGNTETNIGVGNYNFSYTYTTTGASATVTDTLTSADVNLTVTTTLPTWDGYNSASAGEKSQWDQLSGSLSDHEQGHKDIAEQGANALDKSLPGTQATGTGKTLPDAQSSANTALGDKVQQKQQGAVNNTQTQQNAYDQRTDHGAKPDPQKKQN